jgi:hypothetical protein
MMMTRRGHRHEGEEGSEEYDDRQGQPEGDEPQPLGFNVFCCVVRRFWVSMRAREREEQRETTNTSPNRTNEARGERTDDGATESGDGRPTMHDIMSRHENNNEIHLKIVYII